MNEARSDVRVNGDGTLGGGTYGDVTINGAGTVSGDVESTTFKINGAGTATGNVSARRMSVNGAGTIEGSLHAEVFTVSGAATVRKGAGVGQLSVKGTLDVCGGIAATDIDLKGYLSVGGDCDAESLTGDGAFSVGGLLNAGRIDVRVYGPCKAREIGGERIVLRAGRKLGWFWMWHEKRLTADVIEGDDIVLEYTTAKVVRGRNVSLGEGCDVEVVEYTGTFSRDDSAKVGDVRKADAA